MHFRFFVLNSIFLFNFLVLLFRQYFLKIALLNSYKQIHKSNCAFFTEISDLQIDLQIDLQTDLRIDLQFFLRIE